MTPPWVGMSVSQIQNRRPRPGKLPLPQLLCVVAPVLRPTFCTLQLSMGLPVTFQPGEWDQGTDWAVPVWGSLSNVLTPFSTSGTPASLRLQTRGAQPPTQLHS